MAYICIYIYVYLSIRLSIFLHICLPIYLSVSTSISVYVSIYICLSIKVHKSKSGIAESAKILPKAGVLEVIRTAEGYARWYGFAPSETNASVRSMLTHLSSTPVLW